MEKMLKRLEMDLFYLEHRSLLMDVKILWQTFTTIVSGKVFKKWYSGKGPNTS